MNKALTRSRLPSTPRHPAVVHAALTTVQVLFASLPVLLKLLYHEMPADAVVMARTSLGTAFFFLLARVRGQLGLIPLRELPKLAVLGFLGVGLNQLLFLRGLQHTTAMHAGIIVTSIPVFVVAIGAVTRREPATGRLILGLLLALFGVLYLVTERTITSAQDSLFGDALVCLNCLSYAVYLVFVRNSLQRYGSGPVVAWAFLFGALFVAPFAAGAFVSALPTLSLHAAGLLAAVVIFTTVFTYLINAWAIEHSSSSLVAIYVYLQPIITAILAMLWLGERLSPRLLMAAGLVFVGIALSSRRTERAS